MKIVIEVLLISSFLFSCGKKTINTSSEWSEYSEGGNPIPLIKQIDHCISSFSSEDKTSIEIYRFVNSFSNRFDMNFQDQVRGNFVESNFQNGPISKSNYNAQISYENEFKYSAKIGDYIHVKQQNYNLDSSRKKLDICSDIKSYDKNSFENAGLSVSHTITQTYKKIKLASPNINLEQIELFVVPKISVTSKYSGGELDKKVFKKIDTDNAFYHPKFKMISFLPESYEKRNVAPLWEIPMVAAHEYGHHVFHNLVGSKIRSQNNSGHIGSCFNENKLESLSATKGKKRSISPQMFTLRAMNEGFADLIAFYTNSEKEKGLKGVKCFEDNRDLSSSTYGDGTKKYISSKAIRTMDSQTSIEDDEDCNTPNFQRIHQVGASFAYILDRILDKYTTSQENKLTLLLKFASSIAMLHEKISNVKPSTYLQVNMEYLIKVLDNTIEDKTKRLGCSLLKEHFYLKSGKCILLNDEVENTNLSLESTLRLL